MIRNILILVDKNFSLAEQIIEIRIKGPLLEMAIFSLFLWIVGIDRSKKMEQKMQSDFFRNFEFLGVFLSFEILNFFFAFHSFYYYTKKIDKEKMSKKCRVTFFEILSF